MFCNKKSVSGRWLYGSCPLSVTRAIDDWRSSTCILEHFTIHRSDVNVSLYMRKVTVSNEFFSARDTCSIAVILNLNEGIQISKNNNMNRIWTQAVPLQCRPHDASQTWDFTPSLVGGWSDSEERAAETKHNSRGRRMRGKKMASCSHPPPSVTRPSPSPALRASDPICRGSGREEGGSKRGRLRERRRRRRDALVPCWISWCGKEQQHSQILPSSHFYSPYFYFCFFNRVFCLGLPSVTLELLTCSSASWYQGSVDVCHRHRELFILTEVMLWRCDMGLQLRTKDSN